MAGVEEKRGDEADHITFDIRGPRGALTVEKAKEYVAPILSGARTDYTRAILSTWALSEESAVVLGEALAKLPRLSSLIIADTIAGRPEAEGLAVYRALGRFLLGHDLQEIDMSDNAVGPKGLGASTDILCNRKNLQKLFFCNCGMSAEACRTVADIVLFQLPTNLTKLHFHNNMSGGGGAIALADIIRASPNLKDFRFTSSRGTSDGGIALAYALARGPTAPEVVDISDNIFSIDGSKAMASWLRYGTNLGSLKTLNIADIRMQNAGVLAIATALTLGSCSSITDLSLGANEITVKGAVGIGRIIEKLPHLQALRLAENELEDAGAKVLAASIRRARAASVSAGSADAKCALSILDLRTNFLTDEGALAVAAAAAQLPNLTSLMLADNEGITTAGLEAIHGLLKAAGKSEMVLDISEAEEEGDADEIKELVASLKDTPAEMEGEWKDADIEPLPAVEDEAVNVLTATIGENFEI